MSEESKAIVTRIQEQYANSGRWRALVNLVPYVGGSLDVLITTRHEELAKKRFELLIDGISERVTKLEESQINNKFLTSEEAHDLFFLSVEKSIRLNDTQRIKGIASIIVDSMRNDPESKINPMDAIIVIGEMSNQEAYVLSRIYYIFIQHSDLLIGSFNTLVTIETIKRFIDSNLHFELIIVLNRLAGKGLLGTNFDYFTLPDYTRKLVEVTNLKYE